MLSKLLVVVVVGRLFWCLVFITLSLLIVSFTRLLHLAILLSNKEIDFTNVGTKILLLQAIGPLGHGFVKPCSTSWQRDMPAIGAPFEFLHMICSFVYLEPGLGFPSSSDMSRQ